jgi:hypothetical protein
MLTVEETIEVLSFNELMGQHNAEFGCFRGRAYSDLGQSIVPEADDTFCARYESFKDPKSGETLYRFI